MCDEYFVVILDVLSGGGDRCEANVWQNRMSAATCVNREGKDARP